MGARRALSDVRAYYDQDNEEERLLLGSGPLEFARMKELLGRFLQPGSRIADVGGGTGHYAEWLVGLDHEVDLVDPMPLHLERARARATRVHLGDAASLPFGDGQFDAVLLLGPLYHLEERGERVAALHEARRVCRTGGFVAAAAISRLAPLLGVVNSGRVFEEGVLANVRDETRSGRRVQPERRTGLFPRAWFHLPGELRAECADAGLDVRAVYGVQGPTWLSPGFVEAWDDPAQRERVLAAAAELEEDEHVIALSPHLLAVAFRS